MALMRILGAMLFVGFIGCAVSSSIVVSDIIGDINRVSDEKENPLFGYPGKLGRIKRKYQDLYPSGRRAKLLDRPMIVSVSLFLLGVALMLAPGR